MAVMKGLEQADGTYYKVVDSDDWFDASALRTLLDKLREFVRMELRVDLVVTNYVYEHVEDGKQVPVDYGFALRKDRIMGWDKIGHFNLAQNLLMHAFRPIFCSRPGSTGRAFSISASLFVICSRILKFSFQEAM